MKEFSANTAFRKKAVFFMKLQTGGRKYAGYFMGGWPCCGGAAALLFQNSDA